MVNIHLEYLRHIFSLVKICFPHMQGHYVHKEHLGGTRALHVGDPDSIPSTTKPLATPNFPSALSGHQAVWVWP